MRTSTLILCCLLLVLPAAADDFPPISDAERALEAVPNQPGAPAVVLFKKAGLYRVRTT